MKGEMDIAVKTTIKSEVSLVNKALAKYKNINDACESLGTKRTTIITKFKKYGFIYNSKQKKFEYDKELYEKNKEVIVKMDVLSNLLQNLEQEQMNNIVYILNNADMIANSIRILKSRTTEENEYMYEDSLKEEMRINEDIEEYKRIETVNMQISDLDEILDHKYTVKESISIRINSNLYKTYSEFVNKHSRLRKSNIYNRMIVEFLEKYDSEFDIDKIFDEEYIAISNADIKNRRDFVIAEDIKQRISRARENYVHVSSEDKRALILNDLDIEINNKFAHKDTLTMRVNTNIYDAFYNFCNRNSSVKKANISNRMSIEFMQRYFKKFRLEDIVK